MTFQEEPVVFVILVENVSNKLQILIIYSDPSCTTRSWSSNQCAPSHRTVALARKMGHMPPPCGFGAKFELRVPQTRRTHCAAVPLVPPLKRCWHQSGVASEEDGGPRRRSVAREGATSSCGWCGEAGVGRESGCAIFAQGQIPGIVV